MKDQVKALLTGIKLSSEDIINGAVTVQVGLLPVILIWGLILETLHAFGIVKESFDLQAFYAAVLWYEGGVCTLLATGSAHMFFKKKQDADGSITTETEMDKNPRPTTVVQSTTVVQPDVQI